MADRQASACWQRRIQPVAKAGRVSAAVAPELLLVLASAVVEARAAWWVRRTRWPAWMWWRGRALQWRVGEVSGTDWWRSSVDRVRRRGGTQPRAVSLSDAQCGV